MYPFDSLANSQIVNFSPPRADIRKVLLQGRLRTTVRVAGKIDCMKDLDQPKIVPDGLVYPLIGNSRIRPLIPYLRSECVGFEVVRVIEPGTDRSRRCVTSIPSNIHDSRRWFSSWVRVTLARPIELFLDFQF